MQKSLKVCFVGLTHLGINYAVASAIKGFNVVCYDNNKELISSLKKRKIPFFEENLEKNLIKKFKNLEFTTSIKDISKCDLVFISQDVPTDSFGKSDLLVIKKLINKVTSYIKKSCNLVILCQVPPGFSRSVNWPKNQLFYQVETLIFSKAQARALSPERIIVGKNNKKLNKKYLFYLKQFKCPILEMSYESAELAKISINIFLISSVTSTNILSEICENIGAKWGDIAKALKLDKRIGNFAYLKPGLGISGGNLERDLETFTRHLKFNNIYEKYSSNIKKISQHRKNWIYIKFKEILSKNKSIKQVAILGLAYKEGTNSIKNSPGIFFIKKILSNHEVKLNIFDPVIKKIYKHQKIKICKNVDEAMKKSQLVVVSTPWIHFTKIRINKYPNIKAIIDPYNHLNSTTNKINNLKHITMGV